ncbi:MAG: hypothetical protein C0601_12580 [Candidatus Muiribacterium halophilum]|uniref:SGNH hydrolase-type esterase domain-containing protein n=1 Tax=Muiribacterium halophilum TaxID=2053465 RepID=A0A2N5ZAD1_MUIH1|nr:MAG: hypothetical protein C0601_12580 [Candidatus Muirbacterium halophilum]
MKKILVFLVGIIIVFLVLEISLVTLSFFSVLKRDNHRVDDNNKVVYCLGDSFTYGAGVPAEKSYPAQLDRRLREKGYRVYNFGILAANTTKVLNKFEKELKNTGNPDIITLMVGEANQWNLDGYKKKSSSRLIAFKQFLNRFRTVRLFTLLKKYYIEKKEGIESLYEPDRADNDIVYFGNMKILNRNKYDSLFFKLKEKSGDIIEVKDSISLDEVLEKKRKLSNLYFNIYYGDINSIIPLDENELENTPVDEIIARTIKAIYINDLNIAFRNMEFLLNNADIRKEFYAISYYLFKEKDRREFLYNIGKENIDIKGSLEENTKSLKNNIITLFDKYSNPIAYQEYIKVFSQIFNEKIDEKNRSFKETFFISVYNMVIRSSFSDQDYIISIKDLITNIMDDFPEYYVECIEILNNLLNNLYMREQIRNGKYKSLFELYDKLIKNTEIDENIYYYMTRIDLFRFLNTNNENYLESSFEKFFKLPKEQQQFFYHGKANTKEATEKFYQFLSKRHIYELTKDKELLKEISLFYMEVAESLVLDYKYDKSIELFDYSIEASKDSSMTDWEKAWIYIRKNVFEDKAQRKDIDNKKTFDIILKALKKDPDNDFKRVFLMEKYRRLKNKNNIDEDAKKYISEFSDFVEEKDDDKQDDMIKNWIISDLNRIIDICRERQIRIIMIGYPHFDNVILKDVAEENDIEYIDLYNYFQPLYERDGIRPYLLGDTHLSILGNERLADLLERDILDD